MMVKSEHIVLVCILFGLAVGFLLGIVTTVLGDWLNDGVDPLFHGLGNSTVVVFVLSSLSVTGFALLNRKLDLILKKLNSSNQCQDKSVGSEENEIGQ